MKIAVYGDSFAQEKILFNELIPKELDKEKLTNRIGHPWGYHLRKNNPTWTIDNYGVSGSCLWFSYRNYLKHHANYDKNIFIMTAPGRISKINDPKGPWTAPNISSVKEHLKKRDYSYARKKFFRAAHEYFLNLQDNEKDEVFWNMIKDKLITDSSILLIFGVYNENTYDSLTDIMNREVENFTGHVVHFTSVKGFTGLADLRYNHLTNNNNIILAKMIEDHINNNKTIFSFDIDDFVFDLAHTQQHMFSNDDFQQLMSKKI